MGAAETVPMSLPRPPTRAASKKSFAQAAARETPSEDGLYRTAKSEHEAAKQLYTMAKTAGYPTDALNMLWSEAESRQLAMERARPVSASVNTSKQRLTSLAEAYQKAVPDEQKWGQSVQETVQHLEKLKKGTADAEALRKSHLAEYVDATLKHAKIFVDYFATHDAECAQKPEMCRHADKLFSAMDVVTSFQQSGDVVDFVPLLDICAYAETTLRQVAASAKAVRRMTSQMPVSSKMEEDGEESKPVL